LPLFEEFRLNSGQCYLSYGVDASAEWLAPMP
jgi:hypothetical protein